MRHRGTGFVVAFLVTAGVACSVRDNMSAPYCDAESSSALIGGQSVPDATLLACFTPLPRGWEVTTVDIGHEGMTIAFESDRAGNRAAVLRYEESCDIGNATPTPTDFVGASRYEWIVEVDPGFRANRYYLFDGGCVTWEFDFNEGAPAALAVELGNTMQLFDRDVVNQNVRDTFIDEDL